MSKPKKKKLVLFDIDGTLIRTTDRSVSHWKNRMQEVFRKEFGVEIGDIDISRVNGKLERAYFRDFAHSFGISDEIFYAKFPAASEHFHQLLKRTIEGGDVKYMVIDGVKQIVGRIEKSSHLDMGLVTGNVEKNAWLKLKSVDFHHPFEVGAYGDAFEDRSQMVLHAIAVASERFEYPFSPEEAVIVGDTTHDIQSAKTIGAFALGVTTGITDTRDMLEGAGADLIVDTLMDERVLRLLDL